VKRPMKSLIALVVVTFALAGMIGSIWFLANHRWANTQVRSEFKDIRAEDIGEIDITNTKSKATTKIVDASEIAPIVAAFRLADSQRAQVPDQTMSITFLFKEEHSPIRYTFGYSSIDDFFGPRVAKVLEPYVRKLQSPPQN
jgi:hypothetical protein